mmetsp:Transcript_7393/g.31361  ORF Transcript_7393/g.31361 Transcript_7393/m.31361 type:complete len:216 (-) Transcript_7393:166-813(-)
MALALALLLLLYSTPLPLVLPLALALPLALTLLLAARLGLLLGVGVGVGKRLLGMGMGVGLLGHAVGGAVLVGGGRLLVGCLVCGLAAGLARLVVAHVAQVGLEALLYVHLARRKAQLPQPRLLLHVPHRRIHRLNVLLCPGAAECEEEAGGLSAVVLKQALLVGVGGLAGQLLDDVRLRRLHGEERHAVGRRHGLREGALQMGRLQGAVRELLA